MDTDGTVTKVPTTYVNGVLKFTVNHFSVYYIEGTTTPVTPVTPPSGGPSGGGGGGGGAAVSTVTVNIDTNGGDELKNVKVSGGQKISSIQEPTRKGYVFNGWYILTVRDITGRSVGVYVLHHIISVLIFLNRSCLAK